MSERDFEIMLGRLIHATRNVEAPTVQRLRMQAVDLLRRKGTLSLTRVALAERTEERYADDIETERTEKRTRHSDSLPESYAADWDRKSRKQIVEEAIRRMSEGLDRAISPEDRGSK